MDDKAWYEKQEKAGSFWLNITLFFVQYMPRCVLNIVAFFVVFCFYLFCKNERESIAYFRENLANKFKDNRLKKGVFLNFYEFGLSICDKFAVWKGQIGANRLEFLNKDELIKSLIDVKRGRIILVSHFGNVEILRALSVGVSGFKMVILAYSKNVKAFNDMINKLGASRLDVIYVDELDINAISRLKELIESGTHIAIMGDRVPINGNKTQSIEFLGKSAKFSEGAYLIAGILSTGICSLWCYKNGDKFMVEYENIADLVSLLRDKSQSIRPLMIKFVNILEQKVHKAPAQWFNFFDFWR